VKSEELVKEELQLSEDFKELFNTFSHSVICSKKDLFPVLNSVLESVLPSDRYHCVTSGDQLLEVNAKERKSFSDYFTDLKIIRSVDRDKHSRQCEIFERRFDSFVVSLTGEYRAKLDLSASTYISVNFIFDRGQEGCSLNCIEEFKKIVCSKFFIPPDSVYLAYEGAKYEFVSIQVPSKYSQNFMLAPLYIDRIVALKNQRVEFMACNERRFFFMKWNMDGDVLLGDVIYSVGQNQIMSAHLKGEKSIALKYCGVSLGDGYVQYLESILNDYHEDIPAVKGLYYSKNEYPIIVMENSVPLEKSVLHLPLNEVNQVSFLLDIVNCIVVFGKTNPCIDIKVYSDVVFVYDKGVKLKAQLCPLYGYSFILDHRRCDNQSLLLVPGDLQWMENITKYLQFGNYTDKLPEDHLMKKLLEQKWLSVDVNIRPRSFEALREELHDLHGKFLKYTKNSNGVVTVKYVK
jgi:hypothetical protein